MAFWIWTQQGGDVATADGPATGTQNPAEELMSPYQIRLTLLGAHIDLPWEAYNPHSTCQDKSVAEAKAYREKVWRFFGAERAR
jgi:hypothetical protein